MRVQALDRQMEVSIRSQNGCHQWYIKQVKMRDLSERGNGGRGVDEGWSRWLGNLPLLFTGSGQPSQESSSFSRRKEQKRLCYDTPCRCKLSMLDKLIKGRLREM